MILNRFSTLVFGVSGVVLLAGFVPACSSGSSSNGGAGGGGNGSFPSNTAGCKSYKACDLLTIADINKALGTSATGSGNEIDASVAPNVGVACQYSDPIIIMALGCSASGGNGPSVYAAGKPVGSASLGLPPPVVMSVPGLGDEQAWFASYVTDAGAVIGEYQMIVFWGAGGNLDITYILPAASGADPLSAGKQMAAAVLARL